MVKDLKKAWRGKNLPESGDLKPFIEGKPVVHMDTLALFSASQRANGFRKRYKHKGQTASIYLTDAVALQKGKYQIGTLVHTIAIKGGPVILSSIPDQKQKTLMPLMDFPSEHWRKIRTNNPLERIIREIKRRTKVVGAFPDGKSALMLATARLRHVASTKWGTKKYVDMEKLKELKISKLTA